MDIANNWSSSPVPKDALEVTAVHLQTLQTCQDFLDANLTWADNEPAEVDNSTDGCGFLLRNYTAINNHPVKYITFVTYPILLLICTCGNLLTITVFSRNSKLTHNFQWSLVIALAVSDLSLLWAGFFPYVTSVRNVMTQSSGGFSEFTEAVTGVCSFLADMFITSSDWFLVLFGIERLAAVMSPAQFNRVSKMLSTKTRTAAVIFGIYLLAAVYALLALVEYYWFYFNDDKRCPPQFSQYPYYIAKWGQIYDMAIVVVQLMNYILIVGSNIIVALQLIRSRKSGDRHISSAETQAAKILWVAALVYSFTQCPPFIFNILNLLTKYPHCEFRMDDDVYAVFRTINTFLENLNYSINFLLYAFVSPYFRALVKEFIIVTPEPKQLRRNHEFRNKKPKGAVPLTEGEDSMPNLRRLDTELMEIETPDPGSQINGTQETSKV